MNTDNKKAKTKQCTIPSFRRSFSISYYFDGGCLTVIRVEANNKSDAIKEFWKQRPDADRIDLIYDSLVNYA
jgi:hypothetical protein